MADDTGSDFNIKFDKTSLKAIQNLGKEITKMNKGISKLGITINKLQATQAQYGKAVQSLLKQQLTQQKHMAAGLGVMAKGAQLNNKLMQQLINANKKKQPDKPSNALMGILPEMANWKKLQNNFQAMVKSLYSMLPKQIQGYLRSLQSSLKSHLSQAWSKMSSSQQAVLKKAWSRMQKFASDSYNNVFKIVSKGLALASKANKIGMKISGGAQKIWQKTGGKLAEKMPSGMGGTLLSGGMMALASGLIVKAIQASPLMTAMMKIMNTAFTLILRPIGDFFGAFFRPLFIYFLKEVAIPFFQAGRGWMKEGEKWGHVALGFFIDPVMAIYSGAMKAISQGWGALKGLFGFEATPAWVDPATGLAEAGGPLEEVDLFQRDPAKWLRQREGIEEKTTGSAGVHMQKDNIFSKFWETITGGVGGGLAALFGALFDTATWQAVWSGITGFFGNIHSALSDAYIWLSEGFENVYVALEQGWNWVTMAFQNAVQTMGTALTGLIQWFANIGTSFSNSFQGLLKQIWDWFAQFGNAQKAVTTGITGLGTTIWDGLTSVGESIWNGITSIGEGVQTGIEGMIGEIKIGEIDLGAGFSTLVSLFGSAGEQLMAMINVVTGGLMGGSKKGTQTVSGDDAVQTGPGTYTLGGQTHYGNASDVAGKQVTISSPIMSAAEAKQASIDSLGGQMGLGDIAGNRFEAAPGKFVDIYKTVGGEKVKIDPKSAEGVRIQGIYNKQHQAKIQNAAQTAHVNKVRSFTTAAEGQAYVMAGGGEAGIKAANIAKTQNLNLQSYEGLAKLGDATGINHPMITTAKVAVATAVSQGYSVGSGSFSNTSGGANTSSLGGGFGPSAATGGFGAAGFSGGTAASSSSSGSGGGTGGGAGTARGNRGRGGGSSGRSGSGGGSKGSGGGKGSGRGRRGGGRRQWGGIIDEPILGVGLRSGDEWSFGESGDEWVTPMNQSTGDGNASFNVYIGNIAQEADYNKLKPLIQRWILEAASRRGSV